MRSVCPAVLAGLAAVAGAQQSSGPPSFLVIVLDDVGTDKLAVYRQDPLPPDPVARTPNLDALASAGMVFTQFHATPACSSTRAWLLTGRYGFRHGIHTFIGNDGGGTNWTLPDTEVLLPEHLRDAWSSAPDPGYARAAFGKWHLTPEDAAHSCHPVRNGFELFQGNTGNPPSHFGWERVESRAVPGPLGCLGTQAGVPTTTWDASVTARDAIAWIQSRTGPFFAYVAFNPPHAPLEVPPSNLLSAATLTELRLAGLATPATAVSSKFPCNAPDPNEAYRARLVYRAMLEAVDTEIGAILAACPPGTNVFVVSDNGTPENVMQTDTVSPAASGPPYPPGRSKRTIGLLGTRVPLIAAGPAVTATGTVCNRLVSATDLFATVVELAGADPPADSATATDSVSFAHLLADPTLPSGRAVAFSEYRLDNGTVWDDALSSWVDWKNGGTSPNPPDPYYRSVTDGTWRYVRVSSAGALAPCPPPAGFVWCPATSWSEALYDVASDPNETQNAVCSPPPSGAAALAVLRSAMDQLPCPCP